MDDGRGDVLAPVGPGAPLSEPGTPELGAATGAGVA